MSSVLRVALALCLSGLRVQSVGPPAIQREPCAAAVVALWFKAQPMSPTPKMPKMTCDQAAGSRRGCAATSLWIGSHSCETIAHRIEKLRMRAHSGCSRRGL